MLNFFSLEEVYIDCVTNTLECGEDNAFFRTSTGGFYWVAKDDYSWYFEGDNHIYMDELLAIVEADQPLNMYLLIYEDLKGKCNA